MVRNNSQLLGIQQWKHEGWYFYPHTFLQSQQLGNPSKGTDLKP